MEIQELQVVSEYKSRNTAGELLLKMMGTYLKECGDCVSREPPLNLQTGWQKNKVSEVIRRLLENSENESP